MAEKTRDPGGPARPAAGGRSLSKRRLAALRSQLERERAQLVTQIDELEADFRDDSWREPRSDDDAFTGTTTFERERTISLAHNARTLLGQIDLALVRMEAGTYGSCRSCGRLIDPDRLEALPQALLCLDCQRTAERRR